ncbi:hypothetical protein DFH27DRAFT_652011 [Peziza echinospora]|nr:hypothetical protein DFH27DRAFT_652011 [Peziza echinospora]
MFSFTKSPRRLTILNIILSLALITFSLPSFTAAKPITGRLQARGIDGRKWRGCTPAETKVMNEAKTFVINILAVNAVDSLKLPLAANHQARFAKYFGSNVAATDEKVIHPVVFKLFDNIVKKGAQLDIVCGDETDVMGCGSPTELSALVAAGFSRIYLCRTFFALNHHVKASDFTFASVETTLRYLTVSILLHEMTHTVAMAGHINGPDGFAGTADLAYEPEQLDGLKWEEKKANADNYAAYALGLHPPL